MNEPKTADELLALPIRSGISSVERVIDGRTVRIPISTRQCAYFAGEDTALSVIDHDGRKWSLAKDDQGWYRREVIL